MMQTVEETVYLNPDDHDKPWICGWVSANWDLGEAKDEWDGWVPVQDAPFTELVVTGVPYVEAVAKVREVWQERRAK